VWSADIFDGGANSLLVVYYIVFQLNFAFIDTSDYSHLLCLGRGAEYCDEYVCQFVCLSSVHTHLENHHASELYLFFVRVPYGHGAVLLWRHHNTLCTSGFVLDFMFSCNGPVVTTLPQACFIDYSVMHRLTPVVHFALTTTTEDANTN